jgi:hypothetical protein
MYDILLVVCSNSLFGLLSLYSPSVKYTLSTGSSNAPRADGCCSTYSWSQLQRNATKHLCTAAIVGKAAYQQHTYRKA